MMDLQRHAKKLFTPGPLETTVTVRQAMTVDYGSRSREIVSTIKFIRDRLVHISGASPNDYTCVLLQGSGTFAVEAVLNTITRKENARVRTWTLMESAEREVLIISNGRYGERMETMCQYMGVAYHGTRLSELEVITGDTVREILQKDSNWSAITTVQSETTTGVVNHVEEIGRVVKEICPGAIYVVDSMSSFGAIPIDLEGGKVDFMVTSANKCIEGAPGFAYTLCRTSKLLECKGNATSLCLDLVEQYLRFEKDGMFRFTPPTHILVAFRQALIELEIEGGLVAREKRYKKIHGMLCEGMEAMGFRHAIPEKQRGWVVVCLEQPTHPNWNSDTFFDGLLQLDQVIYAGNTNMEDTFRVGNMGRITPQEIRVFLDCVRQVLNEMGVAIPVTY